MYIEKIESKNLFGQMFSCMTDCLSYQEFFIIAWLLSGSLQKLCGSFRFIQLSPHQSKLLFQHEFTQLKSFLNLSVHINFCGSFNWEFLHFKSYINSSVHVYLRGSSNINFFSTQEFFQHNKQFSKLKSFLNSQVFSQPLEFS